MSLLPPEAEVPLQVRLLLAHAVVDHLARGAGVDILHIKGPVTDPRLRHESRMSTDVDVLVRPVQVDRLMDALVEAGFETRTHFETGSIFRHAANLYHPHWGWIDVHRSFPGIGITAAAAFEGFWARRTTCAVAAHDLPVPSLLDQALLLVLHAARDAGRGEFDVQYVREGLSGAQWDQLAQSARAMDAQVAFAAGTGALEDFQDRRDYDLWKVSSQGGTRWQEWRARVRAETATGAKVRIALEALAPNRDHLRMQLGHEPTARELRRAQLHRPAAALRELMPSRTRRPR